jgi:hypothetical protein
MESPSVKYEEGERAECRDAAGIPTARVSVTRSADQPKRQRHQAGPIGNAFVPVRGDQPARGMSPR